MAITPAIKSAIRSFNEIIIGGIPLLLKQNDTAFLSFVCAVAAIDALSAYRYSTDKVGDRFRQFIAEYFPSSYASHVDNLYLFRCRMLHNFSPAYFSVNHGTPECHLKASSRDYYLNDEVFFADLKEAAIKFFDEVRSDTGRQDEMNARLADIRRGGSIYYE